jgi:predicted Zn-dependent peptidase
MLDFTLDDVNTLAGWYGGSELFRAPESFEERCRAVEALSARTLQQVARRTFRKDNLYVCAVGPSGGKAQARLEKAASSAGFGR